MKNMNGETIVFLVEVWLENKNGSRYKEICGVASNVLAAEGMVRIALARYNDKDGWPEKFNAKWDIEISSIKLNYVASCHYDFQTWKDSSVLFPGNSKTDIECMLKRVQCEVALHEWSIDAWKFAERHHLSC